MQQTILKILNIKSKEGIDIQEAKNISLTNININSSNTNPLISIQNGNVINFKNINYNAAQLLFRISGDNNSEIKTSGLDASKATTKSEFTAGATEKSLQINKYNNNLIYSFITMISNCLRN